MPTDLGELCKVIHEIVTDPESDLTLAYSAKAHLDTMHRQSGGARRFYGSITRGVQTDAERMRKEGRTAEADHVLRRLRLVCSM